MQLHRKKGELPINAAGKAATRDEGNANTEPFFEEVAELPIVCPCVESLRAQHNLAWTIRAIPRKQLSRPRMKHGRLR